MKKTILPTTGMVFGVFDGFHPGHQFFLRSAASQCQKLIVVVALPEIVEAIKKRQPRQSFTDRVGAIEAFDKNFQVIGSDTTLGAWDVIKAHPPDIIFLGYDQQGLRDALKVFPIPQAILPAHFPEKYKSGLLHPDEGSSNG